MSPQIRILAVSLWLLVAASAAHAQWSGTAVPLCTEPGPPLRPRIVPDVSGGAIVSWVDDRDDNGVLELFAQKVDASGFPQWTPEGVLVATVAGAENMLFHHAAVPDGAGGVILAYQTGDYLTRDIWAQRLAADGTLQWGDGVALCTHAGDQAFPEVTSDGAGGAIVAWEDTRVYDKDVYAQRVSPSGAVLWQVDGVPVCVVTNNPNNLGLNIVADAAGGAILAWGDLRQSPQPENDVYAQRIDPNGDPVWAVDGVPVIVQPLGQWLSAQALLADGIGGVIVAWEDGRNSNKFDAFVQHLSAAGDALWATSGVRLTMLGSVIGGGPEVSSDADSGAICVWEDGRFGYPTSVVYAQRVSFEGVAQWTENGVRVCHVVSYQDRARSLEDGAGGVIVTWTDSRNSSYDTFAQRFTASGTPLWNASGVPLVLGLTHRHNWGAVSDGAGGAIVALDGLEAEIDDLWAQRVAWDGLSVDLLAGVNAIVRGVTDVPDDEGGFVTVSFDAAPNDAGGGTPSITGYTLWRRASPSGTPPPGFYPGTWDSLAFVPATQAASYAVGVSTLADSTTVDDAHEVFVVSVHTPFTARAFVSNADSGSSVDNQITAVPALSSQAEGVWLAVHPRPRASSVAITIMVTASEAVRLDVLDVRGSRIARLADGWLDRGPHTIEWPGRDARGRSVPGGVYLLRLSGPGVDRHVRFVYVR